MKTRIFYYLHHEQSPEYKRLLKTISVSCNDERKEIYQHYATKDGHTIDLPENALPDGFEGLIDLGQTLFAGILYLHGRHELRKGLFEGYYLEMTEQMKDMRDNTLICPTCQAKAIPGDYFCLDCIASGNLPLSSLYMAFYRPVSIVDVNPKNIYIPSRIQSIALQAIENNEQRSIT